jgi:hypothetical protein
LQVALVGQYFESAPEDELLLEELLEEELLELELLDELRPELELDELLELELLDELELELLDELELELLDEEATSPPPQPLSSREPKSVRHSADNLGDLRMVKISFDLYFYEYSTPTKRYLGFAGLEQVGPRQ